MSCCGACSDPEAEVPFAQALYGNDKFVRKFFDSLSDDGILVMQLGEAPHYESPDETYSMFKNRATTTKLLDRLGFESIHVYEEVSFICAIFPHVVPTLILLLSFDSISRTAVFVLRGVSLLASNRMRLDNDGTQIQLRLIWKC